MTSKTTAAALLASILLAACGGGGVATGGLTPVENNPSSGGTSTSTGSTSSSSSSTSASKLELVDGQGKVLTTPSLSQTETRFLKVTAPNLEAFKRVEVTIDNGLAVLTPQSGTVLTDASGVALLPIAPAAVTSNGVVSVSAKVSAAAGTVTSTLDLQVVPGSVVLSGLSAAPASVQVGQSVTASVNVLVNGVAAGANAVSVAFSSSCGSVEPASAPVDSAGKATAVIQTKSTGTCSVAAAATGVSMPLTANYAVTGSLAFAVKFVKANPQIIYLKDSVGPKSSLLTFKVVDASGNAMSGQKVSASLIGADTVDFCGVSTQGVVSSATGEVSFPVCSGTQPDTVQIRATLDGTSISTDSNLLTVQSGLPSQRFFDVVAGQLNFYAGGFFTDTFSGLSVPITVFAADRQGNPVPDGTPVVFVAEGGQINSNGQSSCIISNGSCSVNLIGQEYRPMGSSVATGDPRPGRVTVLAMADGEEHFIDANNNNKYDPGELFEDLGTPYLDKDEDGIFKDSYKNLVTGTDDGDASYPMGTAAEGHSACSGPANIGLSVENTCNGEWNGSGLKPDGSHYTPTKVRRMVTVVFSGGEIGYPNEQKAGTCRHDVASFPYLYDATILASMRTELLSCSRTDMLIRLADRNGNPLPADATTVLSVRKAVTTSSCAATFGGGAAGTTVIGNSLEPTLHQITLTSCNPGDSVQLSVTVNNAKTTSFSVTVP